MANSYYTVSNDGYLIQVNTSTILTDVQNEWRSAFGNSISVDATTPQGRIIEMSVVERKATLELCASVANQINPNYASGQFLDAIASLFTVERKSATHTVTQLTITGVANTVIPANSQVKNSNGDIFYNPNEALIPVGGTVSNVIFVAKESGAVPAALGTITTIVTPVLGWETANNPATAYYIGKETENDFDLRKRIENMRYQGVSVVGDIQAEVMKVENVNDCVICNNGSGNNKQWGNQTLTPHSIMVVIQGGASNAAVADALYKTVPTGCNYSAATQGYHTVNKVVKIGGGTIVYPITFNTASQAVFYCQIKVNKNNFNGTSSELANAIVDSVTYWAEKGTPNVDKLHIGSPISPFEISSAVSDSIPEIVITDVQVRLYSGTFSHETINLDTVQIGAVGGVSVFVDGVQEIG